MMKKMMLSLAMLAFLGLGASQLFANSTTCEINCIDTWESCRLPWYKCELLLYSCLNGCS